MSNTIGPASKAPRARRGGMANLQLDTSSKKPPEALKADPFKDFPKAEKTRDGSLNINGTSHKISSAAKSCNDGKIYLVGEGNDAGLVKEYILGKESTTEEKVADSFKHVQNLMKNPHDSFVKVYNLGVENSPTAPCLYIYTVMEKAEGDLFDTIAKSGPKTDDDTMKIAKAMISGLAHLEQQGLSHGDIQAANILIVGDDYKIGDLNSIRLKEPGNNKDAIDAAYVIYQCLTGDTASAKLTEEKRTVVENYLKTTDSTLAPILHGLIQDGQSVTELAYNHF